jgi:hypothetical protein
MKNILFSALSALVLASPALAQDEIGIPVLSPLATDVGSYLYVPCAGTVEVQVLGLENTYGAGGPAVPTKMDSRMNDQAPWVPACNGNDLTVGQTCKIGSNKNTPATIRFKMAYPNFDLPTAAQDVLSTDPVSAIVLRSGDDLAEILAAKNASTPYDNQQSLAQILAPYLMPNGKLKFPKRWRAIAVEFGWLSPDHEKIDYNDAVVLVKGECVQKQETVIFDRIGADFSLHQGLRSFGSAEHPTVSSIYKIAPVEFQISSGLQLKNFTQVFTWYNSNGPGDPSGYSGYNLKIWSSLDVAKASPIAADIVDINISVESPVFSADSIGSTIQGYPTKSATFDLKPLNISLASGDYVVAIQAITLPFTTGDYNVVESAQQGPSDIYMGTPGAGGIFGTQGWLPANLTSNSTTGRYSQCLTAN